jgi:hypothetical protein
LIQRNGARKSRDQSFKRRFPKLGHYLIITDTDETENNYLMGLRNSLPKELQGNLVLKVCQTRTIKLVEEALNRASLEPQYAETWIIFDRDQVNVFDSIIAKAKKNNIRVGWSNPCIEIWFSAYFGKMPVYKDSRSCCRYFDSEFLRVTGQEYRKSDPAIYVKLQRAGDEQEAIQIAKRKLAEHKKNSKSKPSSMCPATTVFRLVEEIAAKVKGDNN